MNFIKVINYVNIFVYLILLGRTYYIFLNSLQQSHYKISRMKDYLIKYYLDKLLLYPLLFLSSLTDEAILILFLTIGLFYFLKSRKQILKLKLTSRLIRLLCTTGLVGFLINSLFIFFNNTMLQIILNIILIPLIISLSLLINKPIELLINNKYLKKAKNILNSNPNLLKIAVTGSYGKTTIKNILYRALKNQYLTVMTEKSYNTLLGVAKTINTKISNLTEIFIVEMGAMQPGDIKEIMELVHPQIGIISQIGPQHLETFKNIENIIKTKFEMVQMMSYNDVIVLNYDNEYIRNYPIKNIQNIITTSLNKKECDYYLGDITFEKELSFRIYQQEVEVMKINSPLLGMHNASNILLSIACLKGIEKYFQKNLNWLVIQKELETMEGIAHRLEYHQYHNIHYYDDSYNSNYQGMKNAILWLEKVPYYKIIITPGLVELGPDSDLYNGEIAKMIEEVFDEIYIIKNKASLVMINYYQEKQLTNYYVYNSFKKAYQQIIEKYNNQEIALLVANDLPDCYLER